MVVLMIDEFYEFLDQRSLTWLFEKYRVCPLSEVNPELYMYSVDWNSTQEGQEFWVGLNKDWQGYLTYWEEDLGKEWYLKGEYNGH